MTRYLVERGNDDTWWIEADRFTELFDWIIFYTGGYVVARFRLDSVTAIIREEK